MSLRTTISTLLSDRQGSMAVETAIVAPVLATLSLGAFDTSRILIRQQQLQSAANEASEVVLAAAAGSGVSSAALEAIIESSLSLEPDQLTIVPRFRCDDSPTLVNTRPAPPSCAASKPIASYIQLTLTETYTPIWTQFGIGQPVDYNIVRTVQVS